MRFRCAIALAFIVSSSFGMQRDKYTCLERAKYNPDVNYWKQVEVTKTILGSGSSIFCLMRHAPTENNRKDIVQGQRSDLDIVIDRKVSEDFSLLRKLNWSIFYSGAQKRTRSTSNYIISPTPSTSLFNEQQLGKFEGLSRKEVVRMDDFQKMATDPFVKIGSVESGSSVLNRLVYGIDLVSGKNNELIGICSCQCVINWFLKWTNGNDYSKTYDVENLDSVIFEYKKINKGGKEIKKLRLITETPINANDTMEILEHMGY